jgi:hypothetical protein
MPLSGYLREIAKLFCKMLNNVDWIVCSGAFIIFRSQLWFTSGISLTGLTNALEILLPAGGTCDGSTPLILLTGYYSLFILNVLDKGYATLPSAWEHSP